MSIIAPMKHGSWVIFRGIGVKYIDNAINFMSSSDMIRPLRIEYPDAYYHVMNRGRGR
jgi:hypothetical protein